MSRSMLRACVLILIVVGCNKSSDPTPPVNNLIGSWKQESTTTSGCDDTANNGTQACTSCDTITFTETELISGGTSVRYEFSGNTIVITPQGSSSGSSSTVFVYVIDGNTLTLSIRDSADNGNCLNTFKYTKV